VVEPNDARASRAVRSTVHFTCSRSACGTKKYALPVTTSSGARPETNTPEQRIFANPASPFSVWVPRGPSMLGAAIGWAGCRGWAARLATSAAAAADDTNSTVERGMELSRG
jgi:hypothetical protein